MHFQVLKLLEMLLWVVFESSCVHFEAIFPTKMLAMLMEAREGGLTVEPQVNPCISESRFNWDAHSLQVLDLKRTKRKN